MSDQEKHQVFISYARQDSRWVLVAVSLLKAGGAKVFLDVNDLEYGERWKDVLADAIAGCQRVLVFWSAAAASSRWVNREWSLALDLNKRVVPVMLDDTPLPPELAEFHGTTELKALLDQGERTLQAPQYTPTQYPSAPSRSFGLLGWIVVAGGLAAAAVLTTGVVSWPGLIDRFPDDLKAMVSKLLAPPTIQFIAIGGVAAIGVALVAWFKEARRRARVRASLGRYVNPKILSDMIAKEGADQQLGRQFVSTLFSE